MLHLPLLETKDRCSIHQNTRINGDSLFFAIVFLKYNWRRIALKCNRQKNVEKKTWRAISWSSIRDISGETTKVTPLKISFVYNR